MWYVVMRNGSIKIVEANLLHDLVAKLRDYNVRRIEAMMNEGNGIYSLGKECVEDDD